MVLAASDGRTDHVADCPARSDSSRFDNAAFIVAAANNFESLLRELKFLHRAYCYAVGCESRTQQVAVDALAAIEQAESALAKGQSCQTR